MLNLWDNPMLNIDVRLAAADGEISRLHDLIQRHRDTIERMRLAFPALIDADHLADVAEKMLGALNKVAGAQEQFDARGHKSDREALEQAEELQSEYFRAVQSAVYEYRKRAERARAVPIEYHG